MCRELESGLWQVQAPVAQPLHLGLQVLNAEGFVLPPREYAAIRSSRVWVPWAEDEATVDEPLRAFLLPTLRVEQALGMHGSNLVGN